MNRSFGILRDPSVLFESLLNERKILLVSRRDAGTLVCILEIHICAASIEHSEIRGISRMPEMNSPVSGSAVFVCNSKKLDWRIGIRTRAERPGIRCVNTVSEQHDAGSRICNEICPFGSNDPSPFFIGFIRC